MPGISSITILGNLLFFAKGIKLPTNYQKPSGDPAGKHYNDAFKPEDRAAVPQTIPPWFMPAEIPNKYYQDQCDKIGKAYKQLHDDMCSAFEFAHNMWKLKCKFKDLKVMSVSAIGAPGCLDGPDLESDIKNAPMVAGYTGNAAKHRDAIAKALSKCFKDWQGQVMVPGLPLFPAFAAFPGPMAPPMPAIPVPLIACPSPMMTSMVVPQTLASEMTNNLDGGIKEKDPDKHHEALHLAIATVVGLAFMIWLASQQVLLVQGKGPIPSFAPPYVPVGPVVGGDNLPLPGHLMA